jgi:hypothetical protein
VRIEVNERNLGTTRNFERAIGLCTGDIIALADQDDAWLPNKLEALETALKTEGVGFAFSDAAMVDERLKPLGYSLWDALRFRPRERERFRRGQAFEALLRRHRVTGAALAFHAEFRKRILPMPAEWFHDAWIALIISATARCALIEEPLFHYRQHDRQQMGGRKRGLGEQYRAARTMTRQTCEAVATRFTEALERLREVPDMDATRLALLERKIAHHQKRAAMRNPGAWRWPIVFGELWRGNYRRFSLGWHAVAQDLLLPSRE